MSAPSQYENLEISSHVEADEFKHALKIHQQGEADYFTFCKDCAETGVEKWVVNLGETTCIYFDQVGNKILTEIIPN